jgi:hypothetical protein
MRFTISAETALTAYTDQLARAGVLLDADGARWLVEVSSLEEAQEWASRAPVTGVDVAR